MPRLFITAVLSVTMVLALSACGEDNTELIKELEAKTKECNTLLEEKQILSQELSGIMWEKDSMKYERDAFLEENLELRAEMKSIEEREQNLEATLGIIFSLTNAYREDLADIEEYIFTCMDLPSFAPGINDEHRNLMYLYFKDYMENIRLNTLIIPGAEPILFILHVDTMDSVDLHRPARENCTYYKVIFYQSLIDYTGQDTASPVIRGFWDGLITHWLVEVEDKETGPEVTIFEPNV
jgi:hypothetical protein